MAVALCATLSGCALAPMAGLALAGQGATAAVAVSLGPIVAMQESSAPDQCAVLTAKGYSITESLERSAAANEGTATTLTPAFWRPEFASEGYPQVERSRTWVAGTLVISERSVTFSPPLGETSVRIPFELVQDAEVRVDGVSGQPGSLIVRSCYGRFDVVTFGQRGKTDSAMTTEAALKIKAHLSVPRTAASN